MSGHSRVITYLDALPQLPGSRAQEAAERDWGAKAPAWSLCRMRGLWPWGAANADPMSLSFSVNTRLRSPRIEFRDEKQGNISMEGRTRVHEARTTPPRLSYFPDHWFTGVPEGPAPALWTLLSWAQSCRKLQEQKTACIPNSGH